MYLINGEGDGETFYNRPSARHFSLPPTRHVCHCVHVSVSLPISLFVQKTTGDSSSHSQPVIELGYYLRNNHKAHVSRIHAEVYIKFKVEKITLDLGM